MSALLFTTPSSRSRWNSKARSMADWRAGGRLAGNGLSVAIRATGSEKRNWRTEFCQLSGLGSQSGTTDGTVSAPSLAVPSSRSWTPIAATFATYTSNPTSFPFTLIRRNGPRRYRLPGWGVAWSSPAGRRSVDAAAPGPPTAARDGCRGKTRGEREGKRQWSPRRQTPSRRSRCILDGAVSAGLGRSPAVDRPPTATGVGLSSCGRTVTVPDLFGP